MKQVKIWPWWIVWWITCRYRRAYAQVQQGLIRGSIRQPAAFTGICGLSQHTDDAHDGVLWPLHHPLIRQAHSPEQLKIALYHVEYGGHDPRIQHHET